MERQTFSQSHLAIILSLPGAALCSLPLVYAAPYVLPDFLAFLWPQGFVKIAASILGPLGMVCSPIAIILFAMQRGDVRPLQRLLLTIFNLGTLSVSTIVAASIFEPYLR